jgi:hypothetical protein
VLCSQRSLMLRFGSISRKSLPRARRFQPERDYNRTNCCT